MKKARWFIWFALVAGGIHAQEAVVEVDSTFKAWLLTSEVRIFQAPDAQSLSADAIQRLPDSAFRKASSPNFLFGLSETSYWLKFNIVNHDAKRRQLLLELANPNLRELSVYQYWGTQLIQADTTGIDRPFARRPFPHQNFIFPIYMPPGDSLSCLIYLAPSYQPINFNLYLWDRDQRTSEQAVKESFSLGAFFLLNLLFLSLLAFTSWGFRIRELWYYTIYVLFGALFVFADLGLAYRFVWSGSPYLQKIAPFLLVNLYTIFGTQFIRKYFHTDRRFPGLDRLFLAAMGITSSLFLGAFFVPLIPLSVIHILDLIQYAVYLTCSAAFVALFLRTMRQRNQSGWFLLGFSLHGIGIFITILQYLRLMPNYSGSAWWFDLGWPVTFFTQTTLMGGMVLEIPIMLFIAFKRFKYLEAQNRRQAERLAQLRQKSMNDLLLGIESERRRLAQDLHDGLSVNLAAIKMKANLLEVRAQGEDRNAWKEIMRDLENTYEELRRISHNLPPKSLFRIGLGGALEEIVQRARTLRPEIEIHYFNNLPMMRLSKQAEIHLYRIVLELLNNVLKHAEATSLSIQLLQHEDQVVLTVEDNGKGYDPEQLKGDGIGLANIRNRAGVLEGSLTIDSRMGRGSVHVVALPAASLFEKA